MAKWFKRDKNSQTRENGTETDISPEEELGDVNPEAVSDVDDGLDFIFEDDGGEVLDLAPEPEAVGEETLAAEGLELPPVEEVTEVSLEEDEETFIFEIEDIPLAEPIEVAVEVDAGIGLVEAEWAPEVEAAAEAVEIAEAEPVAPEVAPEIPETTPEPLEIEPIEEEPAFTPEEFEPVEFEPVKFEPAEFEPEIPGEEAEPDIFEVEPESIEKKIGFFARLKERLSGTRAVLTTRVDHLLLGVREIDEDVLEELEEILITSDLGVRTTQELIKVISKQVARKELSSAEKLKEVLRDELQRMLDLPPAEFDTETKPHVIMVIGVNGVGKTTTIAKLAHRFVTEGQKVMLVAADTFRAAAVEQLTIWSERVGTDIIKQNTGADPSAVVYDALDAARARNIDTVIIDTAGRLHTKVNLMEELKKIKRVADKAMSGTPHEVLLVLDATTGQNAVNQAKIFNEAVHVDQLALTKLDGTAKGGIVVGISNELGIPIRYVGLGEAMEDLRDFEPENFVKALFD